MAKVKKDGNALPPKPPPKRRPRKKGEHKSNAK